MRDKHIHVAEDSALLKVIYNQVEEQLIIDERRTTLLLCFKFIFYFLLSVALYGLLFHTQNRILFIGAFVLYGFTSLLLAFNFAHDFSHNTIFKSKKWNNLGFVSLYTLVGAHAAAWKLRHVHSHHYAPNVEDYDSDMKIATIIRVIPERKASWYHRFQHYYAPIAYTTYSFFWVFIKDFVILVSPDEFKQKRNLSYYLSFAMQKTVYLGYILVLPIMLTRQPWYMVLAGFLIMHLAQSVFLLFTFFITHHVEATNYPTTDERGYINCSWLDNQVRSSNDFYPFSKLANFIFGGFNNHIAHHLFPHISSVHYPELNKILYRVLIEHDIRPNQTTYWGGVRSHLRLLKKMSR